MSFMDKLKTGFDRAKEGISDFAETTRLKHEIHNLTDRKAEGFTEIGRQVYALRAQGRAIAEVETACTEIDDLDRQIKAKSEEIVRINTEMNTESPKAV
jgi:methyl-accepting chemotaxis protein